MKIIPHYLSAICPLLMAINIFWFRNNPLPDIGVRCYLCMLFIMVAGLNIYSKRTYDK